MAKEGFSFLKDAKKEMTYGEFLKATKDETQPGMFVLKDNRLDEAFQQTLIKEVKMPEFYH